MRTWCIAAVIWGVFVSRGAAADPVQWPSTVCYAIDRTSHLFDFSSQYGKTFNLTQGDGSIVNVQLCKEVDVQAKGADAAVNYGRYDSFEASEDVAFSFQQTYTFGDVEGCQSAGVAASGRTSVVKMLCGGCPGGAACTGLDTDGACICSATVDATTGCSVEVEMAVSCTSTGAKVLQGLTVGFTPHGADVVENGVVNWEYQSTAPASNSFLGEQRHLLLYVSAPQASAANIGRAISKVSDSVLEVSLYGSEMVRQHRRVGTAESPLLLDVRFRCFGSSYGPVAVNITIPVKDYSPVTFFLQKECDSRQDVEVEGLPSWTYVAAFFSGLIVVAVSLVVGGFFYNNRVHNKRGLDAVPGIQIIMQSLEYASGPDNSFHRVPDPGPVRPPAKVGGPSGRPPVPSSYGTVGE